jgi:integrase
MKTTGKAQGTMDRLVKVAPNLYRNPASGDYYGRKKVNGRRRMHSLDTTDRKHAERRLEKWFATLGKINTDAAKITLGELIEQFRRERAGMSKATRDGEEMVVKQMKMATLEERRELFDFTARFDRITPSDLISFMALMARRGISPRTYNYHAFVLGQICKIAARDKVTAENIYEAANIKWKRVPRRMPTLPTMEQFEAIVTAIRTNRFNAKENRPHKDAMAAGDFVEFLGRAGLGQAEAWNLRGRDIDFEKGEMQILRIKTNTCFAVPIYPKLRPLLERMATDAGGSFPPDERVFKISDAKRSINGAIARLNKKGAGLPHFSHRNFRQMAIKHLLRSGVDVQLIAEWQAHRDGGKLIMDTYSQGFDSNDADYRRQQLAKVA